MNIEKIDLNKILNETRETLLNPKDYFSNMPLEAGFTEPVIKAAIYGLAAGIFALLWSVLGLSALGGGGIWGGAAGFMALIWSVIVAIIVVFIGGGLMLLMSAICGGNTDYEANVRVAASLMAVYPINAFLSFFYGISFTLGGVVGLAVSLYSIYLIYHAAIEALKGRESTVRIVIIVLVILSLIGFYGGRKANRTFGDYPDRLRYEQLD